MKRCKNCKETFDAIHFNQKFCLKNECVDAWIKFNKDENQKRIKKRHQKIKNDLRPLSYWIKKTQKTFNEFIRLRDFGKNCITCETKLTGKFDAGHYYPSTHKNTTFSELNVWGQCVGCNQHKSGNLIQYQINLNKIIGGEEMFKLHADAHVVKKWTRDELQEIEKLYKEKIKQLKDERNRND